MRAMPLLRRTVGEFTRIPLWSKLGFVVIVIGLVADVFAHVTAGATHDHGGTDVTELSAHLVVFIGMALVLLGVVLDGLRSRRPPEPAQTQGRHSDAIR
jgi:hypothetical protein